VSRYLLVIDHRGADDDLTALRRLLKAMLRTYGLRVVKVERAALLPSRPEGNHPHPAPPSPPEGSP
jgi:hypothetical protein